MSKTNIEYFNDIFKSFVKEIGENLPEYKLSIIKHYEKLLSYDNEMLSVNYQGLVPVLINAIKEQEDKISRLGNLVEQLIKE